MTELLNLSWRSYPAALLIAAGLSAAVWSGRRGVARARRLRDPARALAIMQGFRIAILGVAVAAVGAAWWWHIGWLFGLALVIGGQELLESTVVIAALKHPKTAFSNQRSAISQSVGPRFSLRGGSPLPQGEGQGEGMKWSSSSDFVGKAAAPVARACRPQGG